MKWWKRSKKKNIEIKPKTLQEKIESQDWDSLGIRPIKGCNKCWGRGYIGRDVNTKQLILCPRFARRIREEHERGLKSSSAFIPERK